MRPFAYERAGDARQARELAQRAGTRFLGGGTNLVDLMRADVEAPAALVDVSGLDRAIVDLEDGGLLIGGAATNTSVAEDLRIRTRYPAVSRAILAGASGQIRNVATVAGNLLQRTRCPYFYDVQGAACNKRRPGEGCSARAGVNRHAAVLGASEACVATHPSDLCVALAMLDARVHVLGAEGATVVALTDLHRPDPSDPARETTLATGDLIKGVELPPLPLAATSVYRKVRDRASYAFALVSVAAALEVVDGDVRDVRIALGGVAPRPWRARTAERLLRGQPAGVAAFREAMDEELRAAEPLEGNAFKVELAARLVAGTLAVLAAG